MTRSSPLLIGATHELGYANQSGSLGPSPYDYLGRDRSYVAAINAAARVAWSNGDVRSMNTGLADTRKADLIAWSDGVAAVVVDWLFPTTDRWGGPHVQGASTTSAPSLCVRTDEFPGFLSRGPCRDPLR